MPWLFRRRKKLQAFTLDLNPVFENIAPGGSASAAVTVGLSGKEVAAVSLTVSTAEGGTLPTGINVSLNPQLGVTPFSSTINVSTSPELALGVYPFLIVATGKDMKLMATYTLIVRSGKPVAEKPKVEDTGEE